MRKLLAVLLILVASAAQAQVIDDNSVFAPASVAPAGDTFQSLLSSSTYIANRYYGPFQTPAAAGVAGTADKIVCQYAYFPVNVTFQNIGAQVGTTSAGGNFQIGIYADAGGSPGAFIDSTASMSTTTATGVSANLSGNIQLGPTGAQGGPNVWVCSNFDNSTAAATSATQTSGGFSPGATIGATSLANLLTGSTISPTALSCAGANCQGGVSTFNTWPTDLTSSTWTTEATKLAVSIIFKVVSSP